MKRVAGWIIGIALIGGLGGLIGYNVYKKASQTGTKTRGTVFMVTTETMKPQTVDRMMSFTGIVEGDPQVKVYSLVAGKFQSNVVQEGQMVAVDQNLAYILRDAIGEVWQENPVQAPISGIVKKLYFVDRGTEVTLANPVAEVANPDRIKVVINVGQADLIHLQKGMAARMISEVDTNHALEGWVDSVTPFVDSDSLSGGLIVKGNNVPRKLLIGMSVIVDVKAGKITGYFLPQKSVIMGLDYPYAYVVENGRAKSVRLTLGYINGDYIEASGPDLHDGVEVIIDGAFKLYEGARVKIVNADSRNMNRGTNAGANGTNQQAKDFAGRKAGDKKSGTTEQAK